MADKPTPSGRVEGVAQVLILLVIGGTAAAASFTHVHNVAVAHGQPGWLAWADAVVLELMSIATGLEIRRRHRTGQPAGFVLWILGAAVALSLSAQVVEAEPSVVGWLAAALPALGFLASVKIVLARTVAVAADPEPAHTTTAVVPAPNVAGHNHGNGGQPAGGPPVEQAQHNAYEVSADDPADTATPTAGRQEPVVTGPAILTSPLVGRPGTVPVLPGSFTRANGGADSTREAK